MKTKAFTLLLALFAFVCSVKCDEITSLKLTLSVDGEGPFTQELPSSGWEEMIVKGSVKSIIIHKVEVETSRPMIAVMFQGAMYNTSQGGPSSSEEWRSIPLEDMENGKWQLDMGDGIDLIEPEWLERNKTKTFEFYVQAFGGSGTQFLYDNGGAQSDFLHWRRGGLED